ncbi:hypothetical protein KQI38_08170 [Tissierella carlieri]|uniref:hypothetical protein n=1 Tax=Tissierella carlieri TaxID=689904 RepID=UPI001C10D1EE|nr:hypothetical protein [Tissierella carlieri]MBU5311999.1 hypothetical protein [Tissierella carlieri]
MKNKKILFLLIITIFLIGCSEKKEPIKLIEVSGEGGSTIYQNDNIKIEISSNMENPEDIYKSILNELQRIDKFAKVGSLEIQISKRNIIPRLDKIIKCDGKYIETEEFKKELIKKSYGIYDNWISEGLYAKIYDIEKPEVDFASYYANNEFSLFGSRFFEPFSSGEEIESIKSASIDLVEYLLENNKKEELLKNEIYIEDIEKWGKDKNIDLAYQREIESLMNRVEAYAITGKFILNTREEINGFKIDMSLEGIKSKMRGTDQYDTSKKIEQIILNFDKDILSIKREIKKEAPRFYAEYKEILNNLPKVNYIFEVQETNYFGGYFSLDTHEIHLISVNVHPHEYSHFMFYVGFANVEPYIKEPSWWDEGMASYAQVIEPDRYEVWIQREFYVAKNPMYGYDDLENVTDDILIKVNSICEKILEIYEKNDIRLDNIEEVSRDKNKRQKLNLLRSSYKDRIIETIYGEEFNKGEAPNDLMMESNSMDPYLHYGFGQYLMIEYGLEKMLFLKVSDYENLTFKEYFGKTFEELKVDWMNYLKENIKGIETIL